MMRYADPRRERGTGRQSVQGRACWEEDRRPELEGRLGTHEAHLD